MSVYYEEFGWIGGAWRLHRTGEVTRCILWEIAEMAEACGSVVMCDTTGGAE